MAEYHFQGVVIKYGGLHFEYSLLVHFPCEKSTVTLGRQLGQILREDHLLI